MTNNLKNIRDLTFEEIEEFFSTHNRPKFRASQVYKWLWSNFVYDFSQMTNLSLNDRNLLISNFAIKSISKYEYIDSNDGTTKFLFKIDNEKVVEGVLIPQKDRYTVCISSQAGCSLACNFCATGKLKLLRNLAAWEIFDQVYLINKFSLEKYKSKITNIVYMGMGEPLLNISNVLKSISLINYSHGLNISQKRITVSTAGITKIIKKIADLKPKFNLAISLHSANNKKRSEIMKINETNNLKNLLDSVSYFYNITKIKPTYEYVLLSGINDSQDDAEELMEFCKKSPAKVNLIEYNHVKGISFKKSSKESTQKFIDILEKNKILVKLRRSRGEDIGAACGQLATQNKKWKKE